MDYSKLFSLEDKNILISGGLGILGREFASGIASYGGRAIVIDRDTAENRTLAGELESNLGSSHFIFFPFDLSEISEIPDFVSHVSRECRGIHGLVNNAATKTSDFFESLFTFKEKDWREVMRVNCDAAFFLAQQASKDMVQNGHRGAIINILSIYGLVGPHESIYEGSEYLGRQINTPPVYSTSKAALLGMTRYLATCLAKNGIRVNALTPGGVISGQNSTFSKNYSQHVPLGRQAFAHEMVGGAIYLLSEASSYVTGQNLIIDGGWTAW